MEQNIFSILALIFSPLLTFLVSISGHFDIKKDSSEKFFDQVLSKIREEKINIWRSLLSLPKITPENSILIDNKLKIILSRQEQYNRVNKVLFKSKQIFNFYYNAIFLIFIAGIVMAILYFAFPIFLKSIENILLTCSLFLVGFVFLGGYFLFKKKQQLREENNRIISINLQS